MILKWFKVCHWAESSKLFFWFQVQNVQKQLRSMAGWDQIKDCCKLLRISSIKQAIIKGEGNAQIYNIVNWCCLWVVSTVLYISTRYRVLVIHTHLIMIIAAIFENGLNQSCQLWFTSSRLGQDLKKVIAIIFNSFKTCNVFLPKLKLHFSTEWSWVKKIFFRKIFKIDWLWFQGLTQALINWLYLDEAGCTCSVYRTMPSPCPVLF